MKDMTKEEWMKEARYLYQILEKTFKKWHNEVTQLTEDSDMDKEIVMKAGELSWIMFCIEANIKPKDYEL